MLTLSLVLNGLLLAAVVFGFFWYLRTRRFTPTKNKREQLAELNRDLEPAGFAYQPRGDYFYSRMDCWQRKTGYCRLYDEGASLFNMIIDCEPITFSYRGKRWLMELWKGQYGIATGGEVGIYSTSREEIHTDRFTGTFYENISDAERMPIAFVLRKRGRVILRRSGLHWWLTGFRLGEFSSPDTLTMDIRIEFPDIQMCDAFIGGLRRAGYKEGEYRKRRTVVEIHYDKPHTPQPLTQSGLQKTVAQQANANNCELYSFITAEYTYTPDKLEYLKAAMPELYQLCFLSLYGKGFYESFEWLWENKPDRPTSYISPAPPCCTPPDEPVDPAQEEAPKHAGDGCGAAGEKGCEG